MGNTYNKILAKSSIDNIRTFHRAQKNGIKEISKDIKDSYEYGTREATANSLNMTPGQSTEDWDKQVGIMQEKNVSMRETIAKMWGVDEGNNPFDKKEEKKYNKGKTEDKTMTGKPMTKVNVDPDMKEKKTDK